MGALTNLRERPSKFALWETTNAADQCVELLSCNLKTAEAVGYNAFVQKLKVKNTKLMSEHLALLWMSPSLHTVDDLCHTYKRPQPYKATQVVHMTSST